MELEYLGIEALAFLERKGVPCASRAIEYELGDFSPDVFAALERLLRAGKVARFSRVVPTAEGARHVDYWTTKEVAREIEESWLK